MQSPDVVVNEIMNSEFNPLYMKKGARISVIIFPPQPIIHNFIYSKKVIAIGQQNATLHMLTTPISNNETVTPNADFHEDIHIPYKDKEIVIIFWSERTIATAHIFDRVLSTFKFTK